VAGDWLVLPHFADSEALPAALEWLNERWKQGRNLQPRAVTDLSKVGWGSGITQLAF